MHGKTAWQLLRDTFTEWSEDKAPRLGAALAYYTIFSVAPLLLIAITIAGLVFGEEAARTEMVGQVRALIGEQGAGMVETMLERTNERAREGVMPALGIVLLVFGAMGVLGQLRDALDTIWEVKPKPGGGVKRFLKERLFLLSLVLGVGFLLLTSLVVSAALSALGKYLGYLLPLPEAALQGINLVVSFAFITLLFALMFKYIPKVKIAWRDVWMGAAITSLLFGIGKFGLGLYLGRGTIGTAYGAAGSLVVLLVWIYYSSQIFFFGAEFTQVWANRFGARIEPAEDAEALTDWDRRQQGITRAPRKEGEEPIPPPRRRGEPDRPERHM